MFVLFRDEIWQRNDYTSYNIPVDSSSDEDEIESEGEREEEGGEGEVENQINYVVGDVTQPQNTGNADAIIVHCVGEFKNYLKNLRFNEPCFMRIIQCMGICIVDDSGRWGKGGLFSALSARSPQPQTQYELAGRMKGKQIPLPIIFNCLHNHFSFNTVQCVLYVNMYNIHTFHQIFIWVMLMLFQWMMFYQDMKEMTWLVFTILLFMKLVSLCYNNRLL